MNEKQRLFWKNAVPALILVIAICLLEFLLSLLAKGSTTFVFWGDSLNQPMADLGNNAIRDTSNFNWTFIALFAIVVYILFSELKNKNYKGVSAALALYGVHWLYEIANAIIQSTTGYALWTVSPESTSFIILVGVSWELSMMFAIAGLAMSKLLPEDPKQKILGINNRILFAIMNAAFFSIFEIFLAGTPAFIWTYSWWGAIPVFVTTYIPFFLAAFLIYDAKTKTKIRFLSIVWGLVLLLLMTLIPLGVI
ncbi:MAG: hypothetical protein JXB08_02200 [Bacilli bacterium]|nr:hypothetical protein [Bacilli bacterium]MBN2876174.1 hypothetical protein [Bacilli bacterium]